MNITTEQIKELREATGISVMLCKKALEEAGGDMDKARVILQEKGAASAAKKGDRELGAGVIASYVHSNATVGAMVELGCETDFVSKNDEFKALAYDIAMHVAASGADQEVPLLDQPFIKNPDLTIGALVTNAIQKFGEKTEIVRVVRFGLLEK